jgi:hypothetical protein
VLTLYGNPMEQIDNYRMWVLGIMYLQSESLKKLDHVVITRKEYDAVIVWNECLNSRPNWKKIKPEKLDNIKKVPALKTDDDEKGKIAGQIA